MFGTLKPRLCVLQTPQREGYERFYCGVCKGLGEHYGQATRATLTHDAVFMAMLADALADVAADASSCRCPMLPVVHRPTVSYESAAIRYASAVQMLLGDQWLADRAADGRRAFALARAALGTRVANARAALTALNVDTAPLVGVEDRQSRCERDGTATPDEAAAPTAEALGYVFSTLADLTGATSGALEARATLRDLGERVGRAIYLRDALEDLSADLLEGAFNPCLTRDVSGALRVSPERVSAASKRLDDDLRALPALLDALPLRRHRDLLRNVLCDAFTHAGFEAIATGRRVADDEMRALYESAAMQPWAGRVTARAAVLALALWVWLANTATAFAQRSGRNVRGHAHGGDTARALLDAGVDAASPAGDASASVVDASAPMLRIPDGYNPSIPGDAGSASRPLDRHGARACDQCYDATCDKCCAELGVNACCKRNCDAVCCCKPERIGCDDCFKPCSNDCCRGVKCPCDGCRSPCEGCSNPCNGCKCPCDEWSNACSGCKCPCDGCGNACNGCGSGCNGCNHCGHG
jgi:Family of unknown function (DUF5685)